MAKHYTANQDYLLKLIDDKNYPALWEEVKAIGYQTISNIDERYLIFLTIVQEFDTSKNNNFIHYYKSQLLYRNPERNKTYKLTDSPAIVRKLARQSISPSKEDGGTVVSNLIRWMGDNYSD